MMVKKILQLLLVLYSLLTATAAWSAEIHGRSSTQLIWFNNELLRDTKQTELSQYLRVGITGIDPSNKFSVYGYGRFSEDLSNGEGLTGRVYYLYGEYRDLFDKIDIRAGRQFVNLAAGSAIIDGAEIDLKNVGPVGLSVLGGRNVIFGVDGELGRRNDAVLGLAAYLTGFRQTDAEISWFRKWDGGNIARDTLGASVKQYLFNNLKLYGTTRYDLVTESFSEVTGGIKYYPLSNLIFTAEYYQSYPTFDTTSIYSVFAVDRYKEGVFRVDYMFNDLLSLNLGYNRQGYGEGAEANVYHVGLGLRPLEPIRVNVEYDNRTGYYGTTNGVIADAAYEFGKRGEIAAGINYDVYQRDVMTNQEIARRYWLGGRVKVAKNVTLSGRVQDDVNARFTSNFSGRVVLDYDF